MQEGQSLKVFSLWDRKLGEFGQLTIGRNDETLVRAIRDGIPGSGSMVEKHPEDFDLMELGEYFPATGFVAGRSGPPRLVRNVAEILRRDDAQG